MSLHSCLHSSHAAQHPDTVTGPAHMRAPCLLAAMVLNRVGQQVPIGARVALQVLWPHDPYWYRPHLSGLMIPCGQGHGMPQSQGTRPGRMPRATCITARSQRPLPPPLCASAICLPPATSGPHTTHAPDGTSDLLVLHFMAPAAPQHRNPSPLFALRVTSGGYEVQHERRLPPRHPHP